MANSSEEKRIVKIVPCPVCRKSSRYHLDNPYRPFCSERCRMVDLGQWFEGDYRVAGELASIEPTDED